MTKHRRTTLCFLISLLAPSLVIGPSVAGAVAPDFKGFRLQVPSGLSSTHTSKETIAMAGVSWSGRPEAVAKIRWMTDERWSSWIALDNQTADGPDGFSDITRTEPVWIGETYDVQVQIPASAKAARLHVVKESGSHFVPTALADAVGSRPTMAMRADWGARPPNAEPSFASELKMAFVHHTAGTNNYTAEQVPSILRAIQSYHMDTNGWNDIGYNFLVDRFGRAFEGRAGGIDRSVIGAHAQGFNTGSSGVAILGEFVNSDPSNGSIETVSRLLAWKLPLHGVDPMGTTTMTSGGSNKYPSGTVVDLPNIAGHKDAQATSCPGDRLYAVIDTIRRDAATMGASLIPYPGFTGGVFVAAGNLDGDATDEVVTGADAGGGPHVRSFETNGTQISSFFPYNLGFGGGVRVATGSFDLGPDKIVTAAGPGGGPHVRVFDTSGTPTGNGFFAYDLGFTGGVYVAAGNIDGVPGDEIVTGAGPGGGPHVRMFLPDGTLIGGFFAYDVGFKGGARVATANLDGIPGDEIITSPGPAGGPHIKVWKYMGTSFQEILTFWAYDWRFLGGVYVGSTTLDDGTQAIVTGAGETGGPHVRVFNRTGTITSEFFLLRQDLVRGARVASGKFEDENKTSLALSGGPGSFPLVRLQRNDGSLVTLAPQ